MVVRDGGGRAGQVWTKELRHGGALEDEDVVNPGDWCDGGPFSAYFGVAPALLIGPAM